MSGAISPGTARGEITLSSGAAEGAANNTAAAATRIVRRPVIFASPRFGEVYLAGSARPTARDTPRLASGANSSNNRARGDHDLPADIRCRSRARRHRGPAGARATLSVEADPADRAVLAGRARRRH